MVREEGCSGAKGCWEWWDQEAILHYYVDNWKKVEIKNRPMLRTNKGCLGLKQEKDCRDGWRTFIVKYQTEMTP